MRESIYALRCDFFQDTQSKRTRSRSACAKLAYWLDDLVSRTFTKIAIFKIVHKCLLERKCIEHCIMLASMLPLQMLEDAFFRVNE